MSFTQATLRDLIREAPISETEKGLLHAFVNTPFLAAEQATNGLLPAEAFAALQGHLSLTGKLIARLYWQWVFNL